MRRVIWLCAFVLLVGASADWISGQGRGNPFIDHSDTGETVHVLPPPASIRSPRDTQPTNAPIKDRLTLYPASYGSGNLIDHGGPEILFAGFYAIYYNSAVANSAGSQGYATLRDQVQGFVGSFAPPTNGYSQTDQDANYSIVSQYDSISPTLIWAGDYVDSQPSASKISDSSVRTYLANLFASGRGPAPNANNIFGIYFPSGMKITLQGGASCSSFCGYHGHFTYNGTDIKYAVFPFPNCSGCSLPGKGVADMLTIVTSHESREAATDPDLNAWYDASGYEADDKCAWHNLYQTHLGSFWVQPEYSNGTDSAYPGPGCVVPLSTGGGTTIPDPPTGVNASGGTAQVSLSWNASSGATSYTVLQSMTSGAETPLASGITSTGYVDTGLATGRYYYTVKAVNSAGTSGSSAEVNACAAPFAPTGLAAVAGNAQVSLTWSAPSNGADSYIIKRSETSGSETVLASVAATTTSYVDTTAQNDTTYYYTVAASSCASSSDSNEASAMPSAGGTIAAPDAPANLTASNCPGRKKISLSWDASSGATSYNVYRSDSSSGSFSNIATGVTSTGYSNTGLASGSTWWYYVTAVNSGGESGSSNVVSGTAK